MSDDTYAHRDAHIFMKIHACTLTHILRKHQIDTLKLLYYSPICHVQKREIDFKKNFKTLLILESQLMNKFLFTRTAYTDQTRTTLGQMCTTLCDFQSQPGGIQPMIELGSIVMPQALRCCATREPHNTGTQSELRERFLISLLFISLSNLNIH